MNSHPFHSEDYPRAQCWLTVETTASRVRWMECRYAQRLLSRAAQSCEPVKISVDMWQLSSVPRGFNRSTLILADHLHVTATTSDGTVLAITQDYGTRPHHESPDTRARIGEDSAILFDPACKGFLKPQAVAVDNGRAYMQFGTQPDRVYRMPRKDFHSIYTPTRI